MTKKVLLLLVLQIFLMAAIYAGFSFCFMTYDAHDWTEYSRFVFVVFSFSALFLSAGLVSGAA